MKIISPAVLIFLSMILMSMSVGSKIFDEIEDVPMSLYDSISAMDALWEDAYNNCKLDVMDELISEDLEFYQDQGGVMTSKQKLNEALKLNICGKVKRRLKPESLKVYPIKGYGAVQMGLHGFYNSKGTPEELHFSKFVHLWKRENGKWRITRVISLH